MASGAIIGDRTRRLPAFLRACVADEASPVSFAPVWNLPERADTEQHVVGPSSDGEESLFVLLRLVVRGVARRAVLLSFSISAVLSE